MQMIFLLNVDVVKKITTANIYISFNKRGRVWSWLGPTDPVLFTEMPSERRSIRKREVQLYPDS